MIVGKSDGEVTVKESPFDEPPSCVGMEMDECEGPENPSGGDDLLKQVDGEGSHHVVLSRDPPLLNRDDLEIHGRSGCDDRKSRSRALASPDDSQVQRRAKDKHVQERKLSRQDRIELGRMFQAAVNSHDWELSESLILLADPQTLNDALCIALDSIWFLTTRQELDGITGLLRMIVASGARDFTRAALRTSFLASCVSACQSSTMSLSDTVAVMAQR